MTTQLPIPAAGADPLPAKSIATVDVGPLRHDLFRGFRLPGLTAMREALMFGAIRIFTTPRVIAEVERNLPLFAEKAGVDHPMALRVWTQQYRPHLWIAPTDDFDPAIGDHPHVIAVKKRHPKDLPLALLTALLGVQAWSEDKDLGALGTGRSLWLPHALATRDAKQYAEMTRATAVGTAQGVAFVGRQAARAYRATEERLGRPMTVALVILLCVGAGLLLADETRRRAILRPPIVRGVGTTAKAAVSTTVDMHVRYQAAASFLREHEREDPRPPTGEMRVARALAASRMPLTEDEIARRSFVDRAPLAVILRNHRAFVSLSDGRWQFGFRLGPSIA